MNHTDKLKGNKNHFEAAVISVPMDFGTLRMTADMIKRHLINNPKKRILILSSSLDKLRHLDHEASDMNLEIKLASSTHDLTQKDRVVGLTVSKLMGVRRCKATRFDLIVIIDIEEGVNYVNRYLEKCPADKSIWMVDAEKRVDLVENINFLSRKVEEKQVSFFEYDEEQGLIHSLCTITNDMSKKSIKYLAS